MIVRIWHGWTSRSNAEAYQELLDTTIVPGIIARRVAGLHSIDILRRCDQDDAHVEFVTMMTFDDWSAVEAFSGPHKKTSVVPPAAQELLDRYDHQSQHYETIARHLASN